MTAVAVLQCVDRGLISLDEDVTRVLPEWKDPDLLEGFETGSGKPILRKARNMITLRYPKHREARSVELTVLAS